MAVPWPESGEPRRCNQSRAYGPRFDSGKAQYERGGDFELTMGDFDDGERAEMM